MLLASILLYVFLSLAYLFGYIFCSLASILHKTYIIQLISRPAVPGEMSLLTIFYIRQIPRRPGTRVCRNYKDDNMTDGEILNKDKDILENMQKEEDMAIDENESNVDV